MCALIAVLLPTACGGSHDATHDATDARDTPADVAVAPDAAPPHDPKPLADAVEPISAVAPGPAARPEDGSAFTASAASASGGFSDRLPRRNVATGCVDLALERLGATQRDDGSWAAHDSALDLATTGAALLCFSGFGESHRRFVHGDGEVRPAPVDRIAAGGIETRVVGRLRRAPRHGIVRRRSL
jgi:hypothetical protein